jgi:hypothetical protein
MLIVVTATPEDFFPQPDRAATKVINTDNNRTERTLPMNPPRPRRTISRTMQPDHAVLMAVLMLDGETCGRAR